MQLILNDYQQLKLNRLSEFLNLTEEKVIYYLLDHVPLIKSTHNYFINKRKKNKRSKLSKY